MCRRDRVFQRLFLSAKNQEDMGIVLFFFCLARLEWRRESNHVPVAHGSQRLSLPRTTKKASQNVMPFLLGALEGTRTPDLLVRSQSLYPAELQAHSLLLFQSALL